LIKRILKIQIGILMLAFTSQLNAQDVVFKCAGTYYAVKSSSWNTPLSNLPTKRYMKSVNMHLLTLPFQNGWQGLDDKVRSVVQLNQDTLRLKEVIVYADTVADVIGELLYKLRITPYYYLPVAVYFDKDGGVNVNDEMLLGMSASLDYNYCDAIQIAKSSTEFSDFLMQNQVYDAMHGKTLGAIPNVRLSYSNYFKTWVWEVYATAQYFAKNKGIKIGKVAYVDAQQGKLLMVNDYGHFSDEASLKQ
jgi:hypothetical protein